MNCGLDWMIHLCQCFLAVTMWLLLLHFLWFFLRNRLYQRHFWGAQRMVGMWLVRLICCIVQWIINVQNVSQAFRSHINVWEAHMWWEQTTISQLWTESVWLRFITVKYWFDAHFLIFFHFCVFLGIFRGFFRFRRKGAFGHALQQLVWQAYLLQSSQYLTQIIFICYIWLFTQLMQVIFYFDN